MSFIVWKKRGKAPPSTLGEIEKDSKKDGEEKRPGDASCEKIK